MKDRIKLIMNNEQLSPSAFADKLQLGRAVISHILNGRNNPSLDVVTRILSKIDYINPDWLITGKGNMYKPGYNGQTSAGEIFTLHQDSFVNAQPDLFSQNLISQPNTKNETEYKKENIVQEAENEAESIFTQQVIYKKAPDRKISKIIIYYSDNTFETFNADNKPL